MRFRLLLPLILLAAAAVSCSSAETNSGRSSGDDEKSAAWRESRSKVLRTFAFRALERDLIEEARGYLQEACDLDPTDTQSHAALARLFMAQGDPRAALAYAQRAANKNPEDIEINLVLAAALAETEQPDQASATLRRLWEANKDRDDVAHALMAHYTSVDDKAGAIEFVHFILDENPRDAKAWALAGDLFLGQSRLDDATKAYKKALEINPELPTPEALAHRLERDRNENDPVVRAALEAEQEGNLDGAERLFSYLMKNYPDRIDIRAGLARVLLKSGRISEAEAVMNDMKVESRGWREHLLQAKIDIRQEEWENARGALLVASQLRPGTQATELLLEFVNEQAPAASVVAEDDAEEGEPVAMDETQAVFDESILGIEEPTPEAEVGNADSADLDSPAMTSPSQESEWDEFEAWAEDVWGEDGEAPEDDGSRAESDQSAENDGMGEAPSQSRTDAPVPSFEGDAAQALRESWYGSDSREATRLLMRSVVQGGYTEEARAFVVEILGKDAHDAQAWAIAGDLLNEQGEKDGAVQAYQTALSIDPAVSIPSSMHDTLGIVSHDAGSETGEPGPDGDSGFGEIALDSESQATVNESMDSATAGAEAPRSDSDHDVSPITDTMRLVWSQNRTRPEVIRSVFSSYLDDEISPEVRSFVVENLQHRPEQALSWAFAGDLLYSEGDADGAAEAFRTAHSMNAYLDTPIALDRRIGRQRGSKMERPTFQESDGAQIVGALLSEVDTSQVRDMAGSFTGIALQEAESRKALVLEALVLGSESSLDGPAFTSPSDESGFGSPFGGQTAAAQAETIVATLVTVWSDNPGHPEVTRALLRGYTDGGDTEGAVKFVRNMLSEQPENATAWAMAGDFLLIADRDYEAAAAAYLTAMSFDGDVWTPTAPVLEDPAESTGAANEDESSELGSEWDFLFNDEPSPSDENQSPEAGIRDQESGGE